MAWVRAAISATLPPPCLSARCRESSRAGGRRHNASGVTQEGNVRRRSFTTSYQLKPWHLPGLTAAVVIGLVGWSGCSRSNDTHPAASTPSAAASAGSGGSAPRHPHRLRRPHPRHRRPLRSTHRLTQLRRWPAARRWCSRRPPRRLLARRWSLPPDRSCPARPARRSRRLRSPRRPIRPTAGPTRSPPARPGPATALRPAAPRALSPRKRSRRPARPRPTWDTKPALRAHEGVLRHRSVGGDRRRRPRPFTPRLVPAHGRCGHCHDRAGGPVVPLRRESGLGGAFRRRPDDDRPAGNHDRLRPHLAHFDLRVAAALLRQSAGRPRAAGAR